jgi:general secretion pathway protein I
MKIMWGLRDKRLDAGCRMLDAGTVSTEFLPTLVKGGRGGFLSRNQKPASSIKHIETSIQKSASAFTLLEVMVAVSIMAIVLVAVYSLQAQTISMANSSRFHTIAPLLAQSKIAEFEIKPSDELGSDSGDFGEDFPSYNWSVSVEDVESEFLGELAENLKRIDVSVNFNNDELVYHFRTYRFLEREDD